MQKKHRPNGVCSNYQGHGKPQEQRLKKRFEFNFQIMNKKRLCNSKTGT